MVNISRGRIANNAKTDQNELSELLSITNERETSLIGFVTERAKISLFFLKSQFHLSEDFSAVLDNEIESLELKSIYTSERNIFDECHCLDHRKSLNFPISPKNQIL